MIADDSPLRVLPRDLDFRQRMYLDGIRYSIDMAALASERLEQALAEVSRTFESDAKVPTGSFTAVFLDAWSIVDSVNRLRVLIDKMPRMRRSAQLRVWMKRLAFFEGLRNSVQHLPGEIQVHAEKGESVWGSLAWIWWTGIDPRVIRLEMMLAGTAASAERPTVDWAGKQVSIGVNHVELTAFGQTARLSEAYETIGEIVPALEKTLRPQFEGLETSGSDLTLSMEIEMVDGPDDTEP